MLSPTISALFPRGTTTKHCRKSPPSNKTFPPKGWSLPVHSRNTLSTKSKAFHCVIVHSSHNRSFVSRKALPALDVGRSEDTDFSWMGIGILKAECAVLPNGKS